MTVEELNVVLDATVGPLNRSLDQADVRLERTAELMGTVKITARQATESDAAVRQITQSIGSIPREALQATEQLQRVKLASDQAAQTVAAADVMNRKLADLKDEAFLTQRGLEGVELSQSQAAQSTAVAGEINAALGSVDRQAGETRRSLEGLLAVGAGGAGVGGIAGILGMLGGGGGRGFRIPFTGMRLGGGAAFGSALSLAGFGTERIATSLLGIGGSMTAGLLGGGSLLGLGALGTSAVGMGTDMAGIGQAAGDIHTVTGDLGKLNDAIQRYGADSRQAATAEAQLNQDLGDFSSKARGAVLAASQTAQGFKKLFDQATGQAEKTGAEIINQAMQVGEKFLPTLGRFAGQNMGIIQRQLQPLFAWLQNASPQGGLGIFTNLEQLFQRQLPTSVHALSQGFELFAKTVDVAAQHTGGFMSAINGFLTRANSTAGFQRWQQQITMLIGLFHSWIDLFGSAARVVFDLFKPAVGLGQAFANTLSGLLNQIHEWLNLTSTQSTLHGLFSAHMEETISGLGAAIRALLPFLEQAAIAFMKVATVATELAAGALATVAKLLTAIAKIPLATQVAGWALALLVVRKAFTGLSAVVLSLSGALLNAGRQAVVAAQMAEGATEEEAATYVAAMGTMEVATVALATTIKDALVSTGIGALLVAAGFAAVYVMDHWNKVKGWFVDFAHFLPAAFSAAWTAVKAATNLAIYELLHQFEFLLAGADKFLSWIPGIGPKIHKSLTEAEQWIDSFRKTGLTEFAKAGDQMATAWGDAFNSKLQQELGRSGAVRVGSAPNAITRLPAGPGMSPPEAQTAAQAARAQQGPVKINLKLPKNIQQAIDAAQAGHGNLSPADAAAYAYYENLLKTPGLTAAQKDAIYQAEAPYVPYGSMFGTPTGLPKVTGSTKTFQPLPAKLQEQLSNAQAALATAGGATSASAGASGVRSYTSAQLGALQRLEDVEKRALAYLTAQQQQLEKQGASSAKLEKIDRSRATLANQLARTENEITKAQQAQAKSLTARQEERILGLAPGGGAITSGRTALVLREHKILEDTIARAFGGKSHSTAVAAQNLGVSAVTLLHKTNQQLIDEMKRLGIDLPKTTLDSLNKVNEVLKNKFIPPDVRQNIEARLAQIEETLKASAKRLGSNYKPVHSTDIVKGLGLDRAEKLTIESRVSQALAHGGMAPSAGAAAGVPLATATTPAPTTINVGGVTIEINGAGKNAKELAKEVRSELLKLEARDRRQR